MSSHALHRPLQRRSVLQLFLATGLGWNLSACGGGSPASEQDRMHDALQTQADAAVASGLVGVALGLVTRQDSAQAVAGRRRLGQAAAVQPQDRFAIGSNTKAMTSAAILALAERGGPALSMTLPQAFGAWAGEIHPALAQVTLADLLNHRGGLPAFNGSGPEEEAFFSAVQADSGALPTTMAGRRAYFARWLLARPPVEGVVPGRDFLYSNAGYALAAAMVEVSTGRSFEQVFEEVLVQPLALQGEWRSPVPGEQDLLWGHEGAAGELTVVQASAESVAAKDWQDALGPAGHWACTAAAYAAWLRWHLQALQGQPTPLAQAYVNDLREAADGRYLWGWQAQATPHRTLLTHTGHEPGFMAEVVVDRAADFAAFGLTNTGHFSADGSSWVLGRVDAALAEVLEQRSIAL